MYTFYFEGKFRKYATSQDITKKLGLSDDLTEIQLNAIQRAHQKGNPLHACYNPYSSEIRGKTDLLFGENSFLLANLRFQLLEEI
jgi:hypothetical protein